MPWLIFPAWKARAFGQLPQKFSKMHAWHVMLVWMVHSLPSVAFFMLPCVSHICGWVAAYRAAQNDQVGKHTPLATPWRGKSTQLSNRVSRCLFLPQLCTCGWHLKWTPIATFLAWMETSRCLVYPPTWIIAFGRHLPPEQIDLPQPRILYCNPDRFWSWSVLSNQLNSKWHETNWT